MGNYVRAIWRCRFFWLSLVKMDLISRYRGSVLGICWSLLHPIAMTIILCMVFQKLMAPSGGVSDYAPFLLCGLGCPLRMAVKTSWTTLRIRSSVTCMVRIPMFSRGRRRSSCRGH